jgi:hypothetical protein
VVQEFPIFTKLSSLSCKSESASIVGPFITSLEEEELELLDDLAECCKFWCKSCDDKDLEFECCDFMCTDLHPTSSCKLLCNFSFAFLLTEVMMVSHILQIIDSVYKQIHVNRHMWTSKFFNLNFRSTFYLTSNLFLSTKH